LASHTHLIVPRSTRLAYKGTECLIDGLVKSLCGLCCFLCAHLPGIVGGHELLNEGIEYWDVLVHCPVFVGCPMQPGFMLLPKHNSNGYGYTYPRYGSPCGCACKP
jgi:hypothetical protein